MTGPKPAMSILDPTQLTLMRAISGATLRNTVLSNNIANADTPGFQPSDVDFHGVLADALGEGPEAIEDVTFAPGTAEHGRGAGRRQRRRQRSRSGQTGRKRA